MWEEGGSQAGLLADIDLLPTPLLLEALSFNMVLDLF